MPIAEYTGDILLVGINYDKEAKQHTCQIEKWSKKGTRMPVVTP